MDDQVKSGEQLIAELQEIRTAYDELKASNEKEMAEFRQTRADLVKAKEKVEQNDHYIGQGQDPLCAQNTCQYCH